MPRPKQPGESGAISVYFPTKALPQAIQAELKTFPRSSFNGIIAQFLEQLLPVLKEAPRDNRKIVLDTTLWL
jgi:hypothetical protein